MVKMRGAATIFFSSLRNVGVWAVFLFILTAIRCGGNVFFRFTNNIRGAGVPGVGGFCLRNYKLTLCSLIYEHSTSTLSYILANIIEKKNCLLLIYMYFEKNCLSLKLMKKNCSSLKILKKNCLFTYILTPAPPQNQMVRPLY